MFVTDVLLFYSKCRGQKKIIKFHRWKLSIFKQETYHRRLDFKRKNIRFLNTILHYKSQLVLRMSMFFSNEWAWLFYKNCVCNVISDAYSEPCQTSKMEHFSKKSFGKSFFLITPLNTLKINSSKVPPPDESISVSFFRLAILQDVFHWVLREILKRKWKHTGAIFFRAFPFSSRTSTMKQDSS